MKKIIHIFIIAICIQLSFSCSKPDTNDQIINIEDEFDIDIVELLGQSDRSLIFKISTLEEFNCLNYVIDCSTENSPSTFTLYLEDIVEPSDCLEGLSNAKCQSVLDELKMGENSFRIAIKEAVINQGKIVKSANAYSIHLDTKHGIGSFEDELRIIPDNFIWASFSTNNFDQATEVNNQLKEYFNAFKVPQIQDGYYGYFNMNDRILSLKEISSQSFDYTYYFTLEDGELLNELKEFSKELRLQYEAVELDIYTSNGIRF